MCVEASIIHSASEDGSNVVKLPDLDWAKVITNTVPGLLLASTVYMLVDVCSGKDLTAEALNGDPAVLAASIASLAAFSTFLGVFVDAVGHIVFELNVRTKLPSFKTLADEREDKLSARGRPPGSFGAIYRVMVEKGLRADEIDSHYRFTEFSVNGAIALIPFAVAFPIYVSIVLGAGWAGSLSLLAGLCVLAGMMASIAVENIYGWEQVKDDLVFGTIDKK